MSLALVRRKQAARQARVMAPLVGAYVGPIHPLVWKDVKHGMSLCNVDETTFRRDMRPSFERFDTLTSVLAQSAVESPPRPSLWARLRGRLA